jgi:pimeloyl-ACP methyl ester carboxylesterase
MSDHAVLGEVRTSYERAGRGDPLVLLHPGGVDSRVFASLVPGLAETFEVFCPDRRGHGRTPDVPGRISYELMAHDTVAFLEQVVGGPAALVGHSDGAPVALLTALARPDLVTALVFVSGVFHHDAWALGAIDLDEETKDGFREFHAEVSPDGPGAFDVLYAKLDRMHREEPTLTVADLAGYPGPALVMIGDDEDEIPLDHAVALRSGRRARAAAGPSRAVHADRHGVRHDGRAMIIDWRTAGRPVTLRGRAPDRPAEARSAAAPRRAGCPAEQLRGPSARTVGGGR